MYYVFFTTFTIIASMIMYKDWEGQTPGSITVQVFGFAILMVGVYILTVTRDAPAGCNSGLRVLLSKERSKAGEYSLVRTEEDDGKGRHDTCASP